jgi:hypothetical protein
MRLVGTALLLAWYFEIGSFHFASEDRARPKLRFHGVIRAAASARRFKRQPASADGEPAVDLRCFEAAARAETRGAKRTDRVLRHRPCGQALGELAGRTLHLVSGKLGAAGRPLPRFPQLRPHHRSTAFSVNTRIGGGAESLQRRINRCREGRHWRVREFPR